jgi:flagellar basal body-associated protein FliL
MIKLFVRLLNFFAKISLNVSIILMILLVIFTCARLIVLELNVNELENEVTYWKEQKAPAKKPSSVKPT